MENGTGTVDIATLPTAAAVRQALGFGGPAAELAVRATAGCRTARRASALRDAAVQWAEASVPQLTAAIGTSLAHYAMAWWVLVADAVGVGGTLGVTGAQARRHPALAAVAPGKRGHAGAAWDAARARAIEVVEGILLGDHRAALGHLASWITLIPEDEGITIMSCIQDASGVDHRRLVELGVQDLCGADGAARPWVVAVAGAALLTSLGAFRAQGALEAARVRHFSCQWGLEAARVRHFSCDSAHAQAWAEVYNAAAAA